MTNEFIAMPKDAFALRPVRILTDGNIRLYTATTFTDSPRSGCDTYYRRARIFGIPDDCESARGICDILNADGDIIEEFYLSRDALNYLIRKLGCKVDRS